MRVPTPLPRPPQFGGPAPRALPRPAWRDEPPEQITLSIGGRRVTVDGSFERLSRADQDKTVDEIAAQIGVGPSASAPPSQGETVVRLPNGGSATFPAGMARPEIEAVLQKEFGGPTSGQDGAGQLQRVEAALLAADAAGNTDDARRLASEYQKLRLEEGIRRAHAAGNAEHVRALGIAYRELQAQQSDMGAPANPRPIALTGQVDNMDPNNSGVSRMLERDGKPVNPSGFLENVIAGLNTAVDTTLGAPVDASRNMINWGVAGVNALTGQKDLTTNMIRDDGFLSKKWWADTLKQFGVYDPKDVIADNAGEEIARLIGEGAGYAIAPEMALAGLSRLGIVGPKATQIVQKLVGDARSVRSTAGNALAGAGAGAGAGMAMEAAPDEWKPLAGTLGGLAGGLTGAGVTAVPGGLRAAGRVAGDFLAPMSSTGRERLVGQQLREGATSPGGAIDAIDRGRAILPGSLPTTGQMTGDMGLLAMERGAATKDPAAFNQRRADQNMARTSALEGVQTSGAPEQVAASVRQHIDNIQRQADEAVAQATGTARQANERLGAGMVPEVAGSRMREALEGARAQTKARERAIWDAVDPDGSLSLPAASTRQASARIIGETPSSAKAPGAEEAAIFSVARGYGDVVPFSELTALQSRLKTAMREERIANGESPAYRRLTQLNTAVQSDLESAIVQKVTQEQRAVAAGQMRPEETFEAWLKQDAERWFADRDGRAVSGSGETSFGGNARARPTPLPGVRGTAGQGAGGFGGAPGNPGVSPRPLPNFDAGALARLNSARAATKSRAETFDNPTLAPIRKRPGTTSPYDMPASAVPGRIFFPGPKSFDAIRTYRQAVGDQAALETLMRYAVDRLRTSALREDGALDPAKLATFRRSHADALRAFPQLDQAFANAGRASEAMATVAAAQRQAMDEAQRGVLSRLIGLNDPGDVTRIVGSIFGRGDAAAQMFRLRVALGTNPEAREGLRKAVVDFMLERFVGNAEAGTSGMGAMKSDAFQTFVSRNKPALRSAGFTDAEVGIMADIARDLQQSNRSLNATRLPGGSNTAQDLLAANAGDTKGQSILKALLIGASSVPGFVVGGGLGAVAAPVLSAIVSSLRQNGITKMDDLLKQALLDPQLARALMVKATPGNAKFMGPTIRQRVVKALAASEMATGDQQSDRRPGWAA